ncbi:glycine cleavage system protein GcvH [Rubricoccus marinus]|uniref:Glycine cleavage system H protein n=1 Tax=Rubricoccus marinus TaxID=716817 RepID=A0A259TVY9_9BACT|nr:glycine cleavage system protein GcvH [Rubricoccus marinus]OZC01903.1 glycine cleavage system protein H [Rubricoccus marinus]
MNIPADLRYTKDHEWVRLENGVATIGITDYAQGELGDIVFVEMDVAEGDEVEAEAAFGTVEAVKTVSELFAPLAGTVESINEDLEDAPETVNSAPYGDGWMIRITTDDDGSGLMSAEEYAHMIGADS